MNEQNVYLFESLRSTQWKMVSFNEMFEMITSDRLKKLTEKYRATHEQCIKQNMPSVVTMVSFVRQGRKVSDQGAYTGIIMMDFDHLPEDEVEKVRSKVNADPHTLMSYVTISGCGLRVFAMFDEAPKSKEEFLMAWRYVNEYYARLTGYMYDEQCKNANRMSVLCWDEKAAFNLNCMRFSPTDYTNYTDSFMCATRTKSVKSEKSVGSKLSAISAISAGGKIHHTSSSNAGKTVRAVVEKQGKVYAAGSHHEYIVACMYLMNKLGVAENEAVTWAKQEFADSDAPDNNVEAITRGIYRDNVAEHGTVLLSQLKRKVTTVKSRGERLSSRADVKEVEAFLAGHVRLRFNTLTKYVEFLPTNDSDFLPTNDTNDTNNFLQ